jgi:hypothetical protein
MRTRPHYTEVRLYYEGRHVDPGDFLQTPTGTTYCIQTVRPSPSKPQRRYLLCLRWPPDKVPDGATVHPLYWYARKRRVRRISDLI